jgi:predicted metalloprotease with PDZ domain
MLARVGLIDEDAYLKMLGKTAAGVLRGSGRTRQSVAESSFDAWVKYYRQDENAPNAIVSYYAKGSLVALGLDLTIRAETNGKRSLDDVMRALWQRYGRDFYGNGDESGHGRGIAEEEVLALFEEVSGVKLKRYFDRYIRGTDDVPLDKLFAPFAIAGADKGGNGKPSLGVRTTKEGNDCKLANVYEGGAAHRAGLSALDVLVALDGLRVTVANLDGLLSRFRVNDTVTVHAFRRDELMAFDVKLAADNAPQPGYRAEARPAAGAKLRRGWLSE